jgi:hypothetical protein
MPPELIDLLRDAAESPALAVLLALGLLWLIIKAISGMRSSPNAMQDSGEILESVSKLVIQVTAPYLDRLDAMTAAIVKSNTTMQGEVEGSTQRDKALLEKVESFSTRHDMLLATVRGLRGDLGSKLEERETAIKEVLSPELTNIAAELACIKADINNMAANLSEVLKAEIPEAIREQGDVLINLVGKTIKDLYKPNEVEAPKEDPPETGGEKQVDTEAAQAAEPIQTEPQPVQADTGIAIGGDHHEVE